MRKFLNVEKGEIKNINKQSKIPGNLINSQQAGKLRILLFLSVYVFIWFILALAILSYYPQSNTWLTRLFGPPTSLLMDIIYDFSANIFSIPLLLFIVLSLIIFRLSLSFVRDFYSKLINFPDKNSIEQHLTRCLFSIPEYPHFTIDHISQKNQITEANLYTMGGPAIFSSREKGYLVVEKGWKKPDSFVDELAENKEYFLENGMRLIGILPLSNIAKLERIVGQSSDGKDFSLLNLEFKYQIHLPDLRESNAFIIPKIAGCIFFQEAGSDGPEVCMRSLLQTFSTAFIRTNSSTTYLGIIDRESDETMKKKKIILKKLPIQKHNRLFFQTTFNSFSRHEIFQRNRNYSLYPLLRQTESVKKGNRSSPTNLDELIIQMREYIEDSLENFFGGKMIDINNILIKRIENDIK